jgi:hypothetical protein
MKNEPVPSTPAPATTAAPEATTPAATAAPTEAATATGPADPLLRPALRAHAPP